MANDCLVIFTPSGRRGRFPIGTSLLAAARSLGVDIDSVCGGRGLCGRCQITVSTGEFAKFAIISWPDHLSEAGEIEARYAEKRGLDDSRRLSCAATILADAVIDVPAESQLHKQIVRKDVEGRAIEMDPVLQLRYVELQKPDLHDQASNHARLLQALAEQWSLQRLEVAPSVFRDLPRALEEGAMTVTVAIRDGNSVCAVWPGLRDRVYGLAVDVGTTTIAAHLCDLASGEVLAAAGTMNPQIRFGEDVMSRLSYVQQNVEDADKPTAVVRDAIDRLAAETAYEAGIEIEEILEVTMVGNPIMHHFLLGLDALQLGRAPFPLVTDKAVTLPASAVDLSLHPEARVYVLPCIAGHVGADTSGVVLSEAPHLAEEMVLVIDIGTNAEIVLGSTERLLACSSPTGPAFEGGQISCGQRAALGAIERVRVDPETLAPRFSVIGSTIWSDEPGFGDSIADFGVTGICGSGIIEAIAEMFRAGIIKPSGLIDGATATRSRNVVAEGPAFAYRLWDGPPAIHVSQTDVRAIQLAKAALYAGAQLLMERLGIESVDRIVLAGAFGSFIDARHAMAIGMIPDCCIEQVHSAGNAAGTGARIALLNGGARREIEAVARSIEKVETAAEARFQRYFVAAMAFPHADRNFPKLERSFARSPSRPPYGTVDEVLGNDNPRGDKARERVAGRSRVRGSCSGQ